MREHIQRVNIIVSVSLYFKTKLQMPWQWIGQKKSKYSLPGKVTNYPGYRLLKSVMENGASRSLFTSVSDRQTDKMK